ncbi:phosphatidylinositol transfer protein alpha isoform isoform X3 [Drosophila kikkawai]|uniref:Phosphatidylinositol transfer protein alpha isoform isoform X3 n=1 Tax=Drosophila kikkawai TaxID=30033 RepID=A0ABM4GK93_DROKI
MQIKEFRVTLPLTVEEYQVAQLFSVAEASKENTGGGEGIEVLKNEPFNDVPLLGGKYNSGQYTYKIYHLQSKVPAYIRLLAPKGSLEIHEEAWNAYPYCRTIITVHELTPDKLKIREVVYIDIANDPVLPADYKPDEDPTTYQSKKTGRGPLVGADWKKHVKPVMTCYKLVTCEFKWFGLQTRVENFIQKSERRLFTNFHRQVFCSTDRWYGLTMDDIRAIEEQTKEDLDKARQVGEVRGMRADAD